MWPSLTGSRAASLDRVHPLEQVSVCLIVYVRNYLRDNGGEASIQDVVDGLLGAGHDLGKFSFRNVKTMIVSSPQAQRYEFALAGVAVVADDGLDGAGATM